MAIPDPPPGIPRIEKVLQPSTGHYVVVVRLDMRTAAKFPDKPHGLSIKEIGIPLKDIPTWMDGYQLTEVGKPFRDASESLNWFFQKLPGPVWTSTSQGSGSKILEKYRRQIVTTRTKQEVDPTTNPSAITGDLVISTVEDIEETGKALKTETSEAIDVNADPVMGSRAYLERQLATTAGEVVLEGVNADTGLHVIESSSEALGDGKAVKETAYVDEWQELTGSTWDDELQTQVTRREKYVDPPTDFNEPNTSYHIVNEHRSMRIVENVPDEALLAIHHIFPAQETIQLPNVLRSVGVVVSRNLANGNSIGVGSSFSVTNQSTVAMQADWIYDLVEGRQRNVNAEIHIFYLPFVGALEGIADKCGASVWPNYLEESHRVAVSGCPRSQHVTMQTSEGGQSISEGAECGAFVNTVMIPAALHGDLTIDVTYNDATAATGLADAIVDQMVSMGAKRIQMLRAALADEAVMFGLDTSDEDNATLVGDYLDLLENQASLNRDLNLADFPVTITPANLPATNYPLISPGRYLKSSPTIRVYKYGYLQVMATVIIIPET